jgi:hypothetical protein
MKPQTPALMIVIGKEQSSHKKKSCPMCGCDCKSEMEDSPDSPDEDEEESEMDDMFYQAAEKRKAYKK